LLMSLAITIVTAEKLGDWRRSSDLWLQCTLYEIQWTHNWDAYDFEDEEEVCRDPIWTQLNMACTSACTFTKSGNLNSKPHLYCEASLEQLCDCSCDDLVKIERPSVSTMVLGYLAQSLVVVIVGLNMGLRLNSTDLQIHVVLVDMTTCNARRNCNITRKDYMNHWKGVFKRILRRGVNSTIFALPFDSRAYENQ
jgi:hypothetical protein